MKLGTIGMLSVAALLTAGLGLASAQSNMSSGPPGASNPAAMGKCWNSATNTVQDKATQGASGERKPGGVTTGAGTAGNAANSSGAQLQTRPAGMPNC